MASAVVDPGTEYPLMAQVKVDRLDAEGWTTFAREAARESGHAAALEAGELPADLVEHADEAGVEVLPGPGDIDTACECDAWAQPCVHALALLYQLAWQVDRDPYVLMLLRGRTREACSRRWPRSPPAARRPVPRSARRPGSVRPRCSRSPRTPRRATVWPTPPSRRTTRRSAGCSEPVGPRPSRIRSSPNSNSSPKS